MKILDTAYAYEMAVQNDTGGSRFATHFYTVNGMLNQKKIIRSFYNGTGFISAVPLLRAVLSYGARRALASSLFARRVS